MDMEFRSTAAQPSVEAVAGVELTQLVVGERQSLQHYRIAPGAVVPEHAHPHEQAGYLYGGELTFLLADGSEHRVGPGESYLLAPDEPHGAENRGDETATGIDIFSPPRTNPDWQVEG